MTRDDLRGLVEGAALEELPELVGDLEAATLRARVRALTPTAPPAGAPGNGVAATAPPSVRWLTPAEAAAIAGATASQVYRWARGKRWASRPSRKCLRIDEAAFRRWLHARSS